eukprot:TRINITY_DN3244_c0_g1_i1.p1 TRINITY_DN3244_c0_g1~~TRINITY_DN3244_c0_g1_i1.p1  ORF type:complete len:392 (-),score=62.52 TRINITY_DN3244_c0_g1_i1:58-1233(-)
MFPESISHKGTEKSCSECEQIATIRASKITSEKKLRVELKQSVSNFYNSLKKLNTENAQFIVSKPETGNYCIVNLDWADKWKAWIDDPTIDELEPVDNSCLLCRHEKLCYNPEVYWNNADNEVMTLMSSEDWDIIVNRFTGGPKIKYIVKEDSVDTIPGICDECLRQREEDQQHRSQNFTNGHIFVTRILEQPEAQSDKASQNTRRVSSRRKERAEKAEWRIEGVNSTDTIGHLKMLIFQDIDIASPSQYRLYFPNNTYFSENSKSLKDYDIRLGARLLLYISDVEQFFELDDNNMRGKEKELGFTGSALLGNNRVTIDSDTSTEIPNTNGTITQDSEQWECPSCTFLNSRLLKKCEMCNYNLSEIKPTNARKRKGSQLEEHHVEKNSTTD